MSNDLKHSYFGGIFIAYDNNFSYCCFENNDKCTRKKYRIAFNVNFFYKLMMQISSLFNTDNIFQFEVAELF